jgi:hypothetical protein
MPDYEEILCYSAEYRARMKEKGHGDDIGVVLLDGAAKPVLWTETVTSKGLFARPEFFFEQRDSEKNPAPKSNWKDAIVFYWGDGKGYKRLVDGRGEVTMEGELWCRQNGLEATAGALRAIAEIPKPRRTTMPVLRLRRKPGGP